MADEIQDKDVFLVFQEIPNTTRFRTLRMPWGTIKSIILRMMTPGPKGDTGPQGPQGITGSPGPKGIDGKDGAQGLQGVAGPKGDQGLKGDTGSQGVAGATGPKGDQGIQGLKGDTGSQGIKGADGNPKRVERYSALTNASGVATYTFSPAFTTVLDIDVIDTWSGDQLVGGGVITQSLTGCTVQGMISKGTLLLAAGPFQKAGAGVSVTIRVMGT